MYKVTNKITKLDAVRKVAEQKANSSARKMAEAREKQQRDQQQLSQLRAFHDEYLEQFEQLSESGMSVSQLLDFRVFLDGLEEAIYQTEQQITDSSQELHERQTEWVEKKSYSDSIADFEKRLQQQAVLERSRQSQKEIDNRPLPPNLFD